MSEIIAVVGQTGTGKSTSIENLNEKETIIIDIVGKSLPFRGWKSKYKTGIQNGGNFLISHDSSVICKALDYINKERQDIKQVIIDDFQYLMSTEFMNRASEQGWQKFTDIGKHAWDVINKAKSLRSSLKVFVLSHDETVQENFQPKRKMKTIGKMLDEKVTLEGLFTVVLFTEIIKNKESNLLEYRFITQNDGTTTCKSPKGMFNEMLIPNDLKIVLEKMDEYNEGQ